MKKIFFLVLLQSAVFGYFNLLNAKNIVFNNPDDAVNFAIQNSQVYALQRQRVLQNMRGARLSVQDFLPTFNFSLSESDTVILYTGDTRTRSFNASVSQELFDGGRRRFAYQVNRLGSMYAYQDFESSLSDFSSQIIYMYYQYLLQRQVVLVREDMVSNARSQLAIIEKEAELGITLETDYLEYLISFIQIENEREQSKRDLDRLRRRFKVALNLSEEVNLTISDNLSDEFTKFFYEPYINFIWAIIRNVSTEINKQNLALEYARKQLVFSRRWFIPRLSAQAGISFSGDAFPLTEPRYSFSLTIDFPNANLFPLSLSNVYGFDRERLHSLNNTASVRLAPQPAHRVQRRLADIALLEAGNQRIQTERELRESVIDLIISHDNNLRLAYTVKRTIEIIERRLEFSRLQVEQGVKKRIDYLNERIALTEAKISFFEHLARASVLERSLEILTTFPFGGLKNACKQHRM